MGCDKSCFFFHFLLKVYALVCFWSAIIQEDIIGSQKLEYHEYIRLIIREDANAFLWLALGIGGCSRNKAPGVHGRSRNQTFLLKWSVEINTKFYPFLPWVRTLVPVDIGTHRWSSVGTNRASWTPSIRKEQEPVESPTRYICMCDPRPVAIEFLPVPVNFYCSLPVF